MSTLLSLLLSTGITVTLPMEAESCGTEVELGEIAQVRGADPELVARAGALELGYAPSPGYSRLFRAERIREQLARELPGVEVRLAGHAACRVRPEVVRIAPADVERAALEELVRLHGAAGPALELRTRIEEVAVPAGGAEHRLRARVEADELATGIVSVPVEILVDGVVYRTVWTSWRVEVWRTMPVLARAVPAGTVLSADMLEPQSVRWMGAGTGRPLDPTRIVGSVAARDLAAGEALTALDVHRATVVQATESVFLCVRKGAIQAKVPAVALEPGAVGDRIRVRALLLGGPKDAAQELTARVVHRDLVEIDLGD